MIEISYRSYSLVKPLVINNREFTELIISSHYEANHSAYMTDEKMREIVKQLDKRNDFIPHRQGKLVDGTN
jgi:hypothetical protein